MRANFTFFTCTKLYNIFKKWLEETGYECNYKLNCFAREISKYDIERVKKMTGNCYLFNFETLKENMKSKGLGNFLNLD